MRNDRFNPQPFVHRGPGHVVVLSSSTSRVYSSAREDYLSGFTHRLTPFREGPLVDWPVAYGMQQNKQILLVRSVGAGLTIPFPTNLTWSAYRGQPDGFPPASILCTGHSLHHELMVY